jgi:hypothetical protein
VPNLETIPKGNELKDLHLILLVNYVQSKNT